MRPLTYASLAVSLLLAGISPIFFKISLSQIKVEGFSLEAVWAFLTNRYALIGFGLYGVSSVLWLIALSELPASLMYPLLNLAYIITVLLAAAYLKEPVHAARWMGIILILLGSLLVGIN